jgi:5'-nucleotidase
LGQDVYYSGTVSAAREACILGIRSIAVSLDVDFNAPKPEEKLHYSTAAQIAVKVLKQLEAKDFPRHTLLNLNVPDLPLKQIKGVQLVRQGFRHYSGNILKRTDHRGKDYFWVGGKYRGYLKEKGTDCYSVDNGYAALTPLKLDVTDFSFLDSMADYFVSDVLVELKAIK